MTLVALIAAVLAVIFPQTARAQRDACSDVVVNGTFALQTFRGSDHYRQHVYSSFLNSSYQDSNSKTVGGIEIPLGEAILGADFSGRDEAQAEPDRLDADQGHGDQQ